MLLKNACSPHQGWFSQSAAVVKEGHQERGQMGIRLESDAFAALCHLELKGVLEKDVGDEHRHRPAQEEEFVPERCKCTLVMLMSDKAEVNQPLSTPFLIH